MTAKERIGLRERNRKITIVVLWSLVVIFYLVVIVMIGVLIPFIVISLLTLAVSVMGSRVRREL